MKEDQMNFDCDLRDQTKPITESNYNKIWKLKN